ncbi:MAG: cell division protein FtsQ/DivIB [Bifidobacteriaceae bacterium]|jgi:cell division protein FtsQ|nr:cell division protein FtsQ/DivIB [Bifidobacteriaceae bacterium]
MGVGSWLGFGRPAGGGPTALASAVGRPGRPADAAARRARDAFRARRRAARWAATARLARWLIPAAVAAGAAAVLWFSPVFAVRAGDIEVSGLGGWIDRGQVSEALAKDVGVPLIRLDLNETERRLTALAPVKRARVTRAWPTGLNVVLEARQPAAAVPEGESYLLLDAEAHPVAQVDQPPEGLPVIAVPVTDGNRRTVESVLAVAAALPEWLVARVATIGADTEDTVTMTLTDGVQVLWGDSSLTALKAAAVEILLKEPAVQSIDVTAPEFPVVR